MNALANIIGFIFGFVSNMGMAKIGPIRGDIDHIDRFFLLAGGSLFFVMIFLGREILFFPFDFVTSIMAGIVIAIGVRGRSWCK